MEGGQTGAPALSTAESELNEAIEGMSMGDAVDVLIQEVMQKPYTKVIKVDNQAAVNLLSEPSGSWRTRHLRLRANHMRWRLQRIDWLVESVAGADQLADAGTKPFTAPRLEEMRSRIEMGTLLAFRDGDQGEREESHQNGLGDVESRIKKMLQLAILVGEVVHVEAEKEQEESVTGPYLGGLVIVIIFALIGFVTVMVGVSWGLVKIMPRLFRGSYECVDGGRAAGRATIGSADADRVGDSVGRRHAEIEETFVDAEDVRVEGGLRYRGERLGARGCERGRGSQELPQRSAVQRSPSPPPRRVYLTVWGSKWHSLPMCPSLYQVKKKRVSDVCTLCGPEGITCEAVYSLGPGETVHLDRRCRRAEKLVMKYQACKRCASDDLERMQTAWAAPEEEVLVEHDGLRGSRGSV